MRAALYISVFLLLCSAAIAQDSLLFSDTFKFHKNMASMTCATVLKNQFLSIEEINASDYTISLQLIDEKSKVRDSKTHVINIAEKERLKVTSCIPTKKSVIVLFSAFDRKSSRQKAYACIIDPLSLAISEPIALLSANTDMDSPLHWAISPDSTKIVAFFEAFPGKMNDQTIHIATLNEEGISMWDRELSLPYGSELAQVHQCAIDDSENIYLLSGKNPDKKNTREMRTAAGRYLVFHYNYSENKLKEFDISLKDKQVVAAKGMLTKNNELIVAGYYSNDYSFSVAGTFMFRIHPDGPKLENASYTALPEEIIARVIGEREAKRKLELENLYLDYLFVHDESFYLIGELFEVNERIFMDPATGRTMVETIHYFSDIVVVQGDFTGKITYASSVPKIQYSTFERDKCSYNVYFNRGKMRFYYNDHPDNLNSKKDFSQVKPEAWNGSRSAMVVEVCIAKDMAFEKKLVLEARKTVGLLSPGLSTEQPFGPVFLGFVHNRDYRFLSIP